MKAAKLAAFTGGTLLVAIGLCFGYLIGFAEEARLLRDTAGESLEDGAAGMRELFARTPSTCSAPPATAALVGQLEAANAQLAMDLFARLRGATEGNFVVSPFGVSASLAMAYGGARGSTAAQMAQALHFDTSKTDLPATFANIECRVEADGQTDRNELTLANSLFSQKGAAYQQGFLEALERDFGAPLQEVDFADDAAAARREINDWVARKTRGRVDQLFNPEDLPASTRLAVANAIFFKGRWASPFDPSETDPAPFRVNAARVVSAPFMRKTARFGYRAGADLAVLELPYRGGKLALDVLLPNAVDGLPALEQGLTSAAFNGWVAGLSQTQVVVRVPRFSLHSRFDLTQALGAMGMPAAFDPAVADFSGIDGAKDFAVGRVVQQAAVDVNEAGTVAVAATGSSFVVLSGSTVPVPVFLADHPFLFVVRDLATGTLLFIGRVADPS